VVGFLGHLEKEVGSRDDGQSCRHLMLIPIRWVICVHAVLTKATIYTVIQHCFISAVLSTSHSKGIY
jgi:hypothetical protein